jgi:hypothetical protein
MSETKIIPVKNKWGKAHSMYLGWTRPMQRMNQAGIFVTVHAECPLCGFGWHFFVAPSGDANLYRSQLKAGVDRLVSAFEGIMCDAGLVRRYMKHQTPWLYRNRYVFAISRLKDEGRYDEIVWRD